MESVAGVENIRSQLAIKEKLIYVNNVHRFYDRHWNSIECLYINAYICIYIHIYVCVYQHILDVRVCTPTYMWICTLQSS